MYFEILLKIHLKGSCANKKRIAKGCANKKRILLQSIKNQTPQPY